MKTSMLAKSFLLLLSFSALLLAPSHLAAQGCQPPTGGSFGDPNGWEPGSTVSVFINTTGMTSDQIAGIEQAFANWNGVGNVQFSVTTGTTNPGAQVSVSLASNLGTGVAAVTFVSQSGGTPDTTVGATTSLDSDETYIDAVTNTMSHEIGHTFGLGEAPSATGNGSTMNEGDCPDDDVNESFECGNPGPTLADLASVDCHDSYSANVCYNPGNSNNPACSCGSGTSGDCSGGLTCSSGVCGCTDPCDDPTCSGWTDDCGTCRTDDDCQGDLVCVSGECTCAGSSPCDGAVCGSDGDWDTSGCCDSPETFVGGECCVDDGDVCDTDGCSYDSDACDGGGSSGGGGSACYDESGDGDSGQGDTCSQ
jgi:hypothetical protein